MKGVEVVNQADETQLVFEPVLDIVGARNLYGKLNSVLAHAKPVALDASRVERVDTAALQLLAAFCRTAREAGLALRWRDASPALREAAAMLGLHDALGTRK
jgi:phospholipid transport system transporter-binding protein